MTRNAHISLLLVAASALIRAEDFKPDAIEFFEKEVRPILVERCFECHAAQKQKGALRLDSRAAILAGGESGAAAVVGKPADSILIQAIRYEGDTQMPPKAKLKEREIEALTKWVSMGMPWPAGEKPAAVAKAVFTITDEQKAFWAFQPVKAPAIPTSKDAAWAKNDIDRFILAGLEAQKLTPANAADKRTLLRRATFDLTGLPPTPEELAAFLNDNAPHAFAKVIDRLLASPRYGERWGRHWLDVVRYADSRDSRGIGGDVDITEAWRYRDWVVNAFNNDLPYDQFIINQIAGDLLPAKDGGVNVDGLVATGLLTIGEWGTGDADKEKMMTDIVDDQIDVVTRGFMGLTVSCARCHDHKFDPISNADYYALAGIFFSTHIIPNPGPKTNGTPMLRTPLVPPEQVARFEAEKKRLIDLEQQLKTATEKSFAEYSQRLAADTSKYLLAALDFRGTPAKPAVPDFAAQRGVQPAILQRWIELLERKAAAAQQYPLMKKTVRDLAGNPGVYQWRGEPDCPSLMVNTNDNVVSITTLKLPAKSVSVHPGPNAGVAVSWTSPVTGELEIGGRILDGDSVCGDGVGWALDLSSGTATVQLAAGEIANGGSQTFAQAAGAERLKQVKVAKGDVLHLLVLPKGQYYCDTTTIELSLKSTDGRDWNLPRDLVGDPLQGNPHADLHGNANVWQFSDMAGSTRAAPLPKALSDLLESIATNTEKAAETIAAFQAQINATAPAAAMRKELAAPGSPFSINAADAQLLPDDLAAKLKALRDEVEQLKKNPPPPLPVALAAREGGVPNSAHAGIKDARIHVRGSYTRLGESVPRRFPEIIAGAQQTPLAARTKGSGRLELAQWIASPEHPLTARVLVNRVWQQHFGEGLVRTPSNFGKLGLPPTHPELLDYLARQFAASGWSLKTLHRQIMLSATYQLSSQPTPELLKADADNKLFGRMNRRRLEAEAVRDSVLALAGTLNANPGGPAERDPLMRRRMLYLMSIRSDRNSFGPLFDAADSTAQVDKRTISTVAPQALFLLNDNFVLSQLPELAKRLQSGAADDAARIARAYELLYGRPPSQAEVNVGAEFLRRLDAAGRNAEAAWIEYAQVLLCANEIVFVD